LGDFRFWRRRLQQFLFNHFLRCIFSHQQFNFFLFFFQVWCWAPKIAHLQGQGTRMKGQRGQQTTEQKNFQELAFFLPLLGD
jgi:hypothetical protein